VSLSPPRSKSVTPCANINAISTALPAPSTRSQSPAPKTSGLDLSGKKVLLTSHLDAVKIDLDKKHNDLVASHATLAQHVNEIKSSVDAITKTLDVSKVDALKTNLNESIQKINTNLTTIQDHLNSHLDKINAVDSRVTEIENVFK